MRTAFIIYICSLAMASYVYVGVNNSHELLTDCGYNVNRYTILAESVVTNNRVAAYQLGVKYKW